MIILDTNAMPHGQFNSRALRRLRDMVGAGSSIVVPEVVVWEWAEHAHKAQLALNLSVAQHRVDPAVITPASVPATPTVDELVETITSALVAAGVEIWKPDEDVWKQALRQQVLQVGAGEVKDGIKTGAADAVVLASAKHFEYRSEPPVLLYSSDARLRTQAKSEAPDLLVANATRDILTQLSDFEPPADDLEVRAAEVIPDVLNQRIAEGEPALAFDDYGVELYAGDGRYSADFKIQPRDITFSRVDLVEFHDFEIARVADARFGFGKMRIFGDFELSYLESRETSPGVFELVGDVAGPFGTAYVDVTVSIQWDLGWNFQDITPTGTAVAVTGDDEEYDDPEADVPPFHATESSAVPTRR